jgi:hypothetical protein
MDITFGIVHFSDGIQRAELSAETNEKLYTYRFTQYSNDIQSLVNMRPVDALPVTPSTRKLSQVLDKVHAQLQRMLQTGHNTEEYKSLFWEVKGILKNEVIK